MLTPATPWQTIERAVTIPVPMPVSFQVRPLETGSWEAMTRDLGTPIHVVASSRRKALARLEELVTVSLERLVAERALAAG